ncbi:unnamed protein product [Pleuronectes platessa]|uniref:Uncharacterized protein n=1 Tax=Pleuronectes platessa TaxID=8262 RepID=A0A9N7V6I6_PLEPL|nr:unnamed protein product [Pleuronectes platessa]
MLKTPNGNIKISSTRCVGVQEPAPAAVALERSSLQALGNSSTTVDRWASPPPAQPVSPSSFSYLHLDTSYSSADLYLMEIHIKSAPEALRPGYAIAVGFVLLIIFTAKDSQSCHTLGSTYQPVLFGKQLLIRGQIKSSYSVFIPRDGKRNLEDYQALGTRTKSSSWRIQIVINSPCSLQEEADRSADFNVVKNKQSFVFMTRFERRTEEVLSCSCSPGLLIVTIWISLTPERFERCSLSLIGSDHRSPSQHGHE